MGVVLFTTLESSVILRTANGVFKQVNIAHRKEYVYACVGPTSFVMLYKDNTTSNPSLRWIEMEGKYEADSFGRLISTSLNKGKNNG